ncbi:MAG TPA: Holliday junction resolvase RecU [Bacilli bacterium]|nr:Holliday junction resolvase RecU [Bacilli bacterium]
MINYPFGKRVNTSSTTSSRRNKNLTLNSANRGMSFETDINFSNDYYAQKHIALITKRPTPIKVVKVDYSRGARITDAYFSMQSTTDYNGIYHGRYIDFEAKSSHSKTSFPLNNITLHQFAHLKEVFLQGGIAFFLIEFTKLNEVYFLDARFVVDWHENQQKKSIPLAKIKENGRLIKQGLRPRIDYLPTIIDFYSL